ncbi:methionyl-tRNA formyltransferase [Luteipulveratus halotolerans]|uniref:Methionyl-tRNA formyltransferase n=1 Tax=Luteipulveratus halotolerans TaxID=1631356 RepID=A0A0L6CI45_9MICO|nr:methionyl-tRNA formyltransferase [Luteipulveratus halotolerans]KNX37300.1 methionyl-tRNA formyltransferase [Luteipulveratus halotolerans]
MRVVFAGTPEVAVPSLDAVLASEHEVVAVVTRPDARAGRGRRTVASPVRARAEDAGLEVLTPARPSEPEFQQRLRELAPDVCPVVAYGALVPRAALDIPRLGWVNLHFSLLPAWRGAAPVQHAVMHGDEVTGATTFVLEEGMDTGPVLGTLTETVRPTDTSGDLLDRLAQAGAGLLVASLDALAEGRAVPVPQPADGVSLAPKITTDDAEIRWHEPAFAVDRRIRACTPAPGAWTTFRGERMKVQPVTVADAEPVPPGQVVVGKRDVLVGTATAPVRLGTVQAAGKKAMAAADWARGTRIDDAEVLGG